MTENTKLLQTPDVGHFPDLELLLLQQTCLGIYEGFLFSVDHDLGVRTFGVGKEQDDNDDDGQGRHGDDQPPAGGHQLEQPLHLDSGLFLKRRGRTD